MKSFLFTYLHYNQLIYNKIDVMLIIIYTNMGWWNHPREWDNYTPEEN